MAERITLREHVAGTAVLVATGSERLQLSEHATGTVSNAAYSNETISFSEYAVAVVEGRGFSRETVVFSERLVGAVGIRGGVLRESLNFSEHASTSLWGQNRESVLFSEHASGVSLILGSSQERLAFSEKIRGVLVETFEDVWVVNMHHGGHSRYVGDLTGVQPVDAYILMPASQLGFDQAKAVYDVYTHGRVEGNLAVTAMVDEQLEVAGEGFLDDGRAGMHRVRSKMPEGARGVIWQLKVANVEGANFTLKSIDVTPIVSKRSR